ncbi:MAG TPA: STAS/SEC14 domain-containing protein [Chitinophagaceae bacterium]|nr:STAS/SEC14 domain-containing protein [Chitinophagaceae bacterium]
MIEVIEGFPAYVTAFRATGAVTREDYHTTINPMVKNVAASTGKINYMLILNTALKNYTLGAWIEDGMLGLRYWSKWNKLAIVTGKNGIKKFTNTFGIFIPCPARGFKIEELPQAREWISVL